LDIHIPHNIRTLACDIIKTAAGARAEIQSFRWADGGGLYNKVYCIDTTAGAFILKIECDNIFPSTRKMQIENEVEGRRLLAQAGVPCPRIVAHGYGDTDIGARYVLTECLSSDWPVIALMDQMDESTKAEVTRQGIDIINRMSAITHTHFGSLLPSGPLGWHETWAGCRRAWFDLLIDDCNSIGLFTDDELAAVKAAAEMTPHAETTPVFSTEDAGWHNMIWGRANGGPEMLYAVDFGNSRYIPAFVGGYYTDNIGMLGRPPHHIPELIELDKQYNLFILYAFEEMLWREAEKLITDYAHVREWMAASIERAKADTSRDHITAFVDKCRALCG